MVTSEAAPVRLIPRWWTATVLVLLSVLTLGALVLGASSQGPMGVSAWLFALATGAGLLAAVSALLRPRRRREPSTRPDGTLVLRAPLLTVVALLVAWAAVTVAAAIWGYVALTDFDEIEAPGATLLAVVGAVGMLPDLVRLLTGRLHRWTLEVGPETVRYRGYRTDRAWPRREVRGGTIQRRGPAGVRIEVKGGDGPVVPITAFDVPAEQVVELLRRR